MTICSVPRCDRPVGNKGAKGMCPTHYKRYKAGSDISRPIVPHGQAAGSICSVDGCDKPVKARNLCTTHHQRWRVHGDPSIVLGSWSNRLTIIEHIWDFVDKNGPIPSNPWCPVEGNCWIWTRGLDAYGYGSIQGIGAYRIIYEMEHGEIPPQMTIDHLCRVRACVRPNHLEVVTRAENARRGTNSMKTHCPRGHAYDEENTHINKRGSRICRQCARERAQLRPAASTS